MCQLLDEEAHASISVIRVFLSLFLFALGLEMTLGFVLFVYLCFSVSLVSFLGGGIFGFFPVGCGWKKKKTKSVAVDDQLKKYLEKNMEAKKSVVWRCNESNRVAAVCG